MTDHMSRRELKEAADAAILARNKEKLSTLAIAAHETVEPYLTELIPLERCKEIAHQGYVRSVIESQEIDGVRAFQSVVQMRIDENTGEMIEVTFYEPAEVMKQNREMHRASLRSSWKAIRGFLKRTPDLDEDLKRVVLASLEAAFTEMHRRLKEQDAA